jgi:hypothetical protein
MITIVGFLLFASTTSLSSVQIGNAKDSSVPHPVFAEAPKAPNGLTLYNERENWLPVAKRRTTHFAIAKSNPE